MTVQEWLGEDNKLGHDIWNNKYCYNGESVEEFADRVSGGNEVLKRLILEKKFLFGGRTNANRNTGKRASMMNCYSAGFVKDSLDDIMKVNTDIALTYKTQGGQGLSLSQLRPKGTGINNGQFTSDGIVPFMEMYNRTTASISQGGSRKGALIMSLDIWHKEAEEFIKIKSEAGRIEKANLSLEIDDEFMECVKKYYETGEVVTKHITRNYNDNVIEYDVTPINLYKLMMERAYDWGEPGCIFTNRFRNYNLMEYCDDYMIETCNPCGEQPLAKNSACDLGSINLSEFVINPFTESAKFDFDSFAVAIDEGIRALDEIIDENKDNHALKEQKEMSLNYRNIGLGTMGMWDMLCKLNIKYGSVESKCFLDTLFGFMFRRAVIMSSKLAKEKGAFPKYSSNVLNSKIIKEHFTNDELHILEIDKYGLRNCSLLSIAPTGSIGTMFNISTGCEPIFQISYKRKTESLNGEDTFYDVYVDLAKEYMEKFNTDTLPDSFVSAGEIYWKDRVDIQAIIQKHVDTAISSTINLPNEITREGVEQVYLYAWEKGVKGLTIFRDGCAKAAIISTNKTQDTKENETTLKTNNTSSKLERGMIIKVNDDLLSQKRTLKSGCGKMYLHLDFDENTGEPFETWIDIGGDGGCERNLTFISRLMSLLLRAGVPLSEIIEQTKSIKPCPAYVARTYKFGDTSPGTSCPSSLGIALKELEDKIHKACFSDDEEDEGYNKMSDSTKNVVEIKGTFKVVNDCTVSSNMACPDCGSELSAEGGCFTCHQCGYSKCG